jgi:hypothetical protein
MQRVITSWVPGRRVFPSSSGCEWFGRAQDWWGEAPERTKNVRQDLRVRRNYHGLGRPAAEPRSLIR